MSGAFGTIGIPAGIQMCYTRFAMDLAALVGTTQAALMREGRHCAVIGAATCFISQARNSLAERAHGDWLFMSDTDHSFAPDTLLRLLETMYATTPPLPVVSGLYFSRGSHLPQLWMFGDEEDPGIIGQVERFNAHDRPFEVDAVGAGCLLVQTAVFERIRTELGREPFAPISVRGHEIQDDIAFCYNCRELEIPVVCDPRVLSLHLETHGVTTDDWERALEQTGSDRA